MTKRLRETRAQCHLARAEVSVSGRLGTGAGCPTFDLAGTGCAVAGKAPNKCVKMVL